MATVPPSPTTLPPLSNPDDAPPQTVFDDPDADIILRSCDSQEFRVLKLYIIKSSPVLCEQIRAIPNPPCPASSISAEIPLPVVPLTDSGAILSTLLNFIFPVSPVLPPTLEEIMELLSVAQKYEMVSVLAHIRGCISLKDPPFICAENAFYAYSLAQKYGLPKEASQAAKLTLAFTLTIEDLEGKLDVMQGAYLHELWKYHQDVQRNLASTIEDFIVSTANSTLSGLNCAAYNEGIPSWLYDYIYCIGVAPSSFDLIEFQRALSCHTKDVVPRRGHIKLGCASCAVIPSQTIRTFWTALTKFVNENIASFIGTNITHWLGEEICPQDHTCLPVAVLPLPEYLYTTEADVIIQSSDLVNFRVHKSILTSSSQFFRTMFSLPQPPNEVADGLPVLHMSEDAEIVRALVTLLYPIPSEIPVAYDRVLALLAASQKYEMPAVELSIRTEVSYRNIAPQTGDQIFRAYAIASRNRLSPETNTAACLTLNYPLTFECLGSELRQFEGWTLRDLARFHQRYRAVITSCLLSFLDIRSGPSKIWVGCPTSASSPEGGEPVLPSWLNALFTRQIGKLGGKFTNAFIQPSSIREKYLAALRGHTVDCSFCLGVHARQGEEYCVELEKKLAQAQNRVFETGVNEPSLRSP